MLGIFALSAALKEEELEKFQAGLALLDKQGIKYTQAANLSKKEGRSLQTAFFKN